MTNRNLFYAFTALYLICLLVYTFFIYKKENKEDVYSWTEYHLIVDTMDYEKPYLMYDRNGYYIGSIDASDLDKIIHD